MKTKKCNNCGVQRELFYFESHAKAKDGLRKMCNICIAKTPKITKSEHGVDTYKGQVKKALKNGTMEQDDFSIFMLNSIGVNYK